MIEAGVNMESPWKPWLEVFQQLGVAGLFIAMYLTTIKYFYKELKESKKDVQTSAEKQAAALESSTRAIESSVEIGEKVVSGLDAVKAQTSEFIAYLKGRDDGRSQQ